MKRFLCLLMAVVLCLPFFIFSAYAETEVLMGDLDGDGGLTTKDALKVLKIASCQIIPTTKEKELSDMNSDGVITLDDVYQVLHKLLAPESDAWYINSLLEAGFPLSYAEPLLALHKKYPQWEFEPFKTGLKWSDAVSGENSPHKKQLIEKNVDEIWKCQCSSCKGVIQEGSTWVSASREAVEYYLDPRNFLTDNYIFQFETTAYDEDQTIEAVEAILKPTWMYQSEITYLDALGATKTYKLDGVTIKYSEAIMKAAKENGMSAYYLASKIVQEVGSSTSSYAGGSSGKKAPYNGIYNYYNIGAYTGVVDGLKWANGYMQTSAEATLYKTASTSGTAVKTLAKGTELYYIGKSGSFYRVKAKVDSTEYTGYISTGSVSMSTSYGRPWTNPYQTIYYGAQYIYKSFSQYQFTGYLQKFNVNAESGKLYNHEYMANIRAAAAESNKVFKAYDSNGILSSKRVFSIPVFEGMPNANSGNEDRFVATVPVLKSTAKTKTSITLDWTKVLDATGYQIYKYDAENDKYVKLTNASGQAYTESSLKAGESYKYKVRAYKKNADGTYSYSAFSTVLTVTTKSDTTTPSGTTTASKTGVVKISEGNLNIRASASTSGDVVIKVQNGQAVTITGVSGEWYKVSLVYNGITYNGYAHSDYIVVDEQVTQSKETCPYAEPTSTVLSGSSGDSVRWVQWHLYKLGYIEETGIDGAFGPATLAAVKELQTDEGLDVDGKVGPATRTAIISAYAKL